MSPTVVYDAPGEVIVWFDEDAQEILVTWVRFGDQHVFKESLDVQAELVEAGRAKYVIVDVATTTGTPSARDQDYVNRFVFPRYREGGLEAIITVVPQSAVTKMGAKRWIHNGNAWRFGMYETASVEDARRLVDEQYRQRTA